MSRVPFPDRSLRNRQAPHQTLVSISIIGSTRAELRLLRRQCRNGADLIRGDTMVLCGCGVPTRNSVDAAWRVPPLVYNAAPQPNGTAPGRPERLRGVLPSPADGH
jgi:hypothetical protein